MGIYGALSTAVSGLRAQAFALENISGNIANSQTTGYKRMETGFIDMVTDAAVGRQVAGAVSAYSRSTNDVRGDIINSSTGTHVALTGSGFFVVGERTGMSDGNSIIGGSNFYTRRGDFEMDREGYLVNGAGYYLKGVPIGATGNPIGSVPETIKIDNGVIPARETSRINYGLNLPADPAVGLYTGGLTDISGLDLEPFKEASLNGGAITTFASNGAPVQVELRWAKTDDAPDTWQLYYQTASDPERWLAVDDAVATFNTNGTLATLNGDPVGANQVANISMGGIEVNGTTLGDVELNFGTGGLTQFANTSGRASDIQLFQNGFPAGSFLGVEISDAGRVVATYSNGEQVDLYQLVTADFNAANMLKRLDGGVYAATTQSGEPIFSLEGGIAGSALEASNTDISDEFTKLIVTQQAYAASTRIVSTSDEMLREALNMVR